MFARRRVSEARRSRSRARLSIFRFVYRRLSVALGSSNGIPRGDASRMRTSVRARAKRTHASVKRPLYSAPELGSLSANYRVPLSRR